LYVDNERQQQAQEQADPAHSGAQSKTSYHVQNAEWTGLPMGIQVEPKVDQSPGIQRRHLDHTRHGQRTQRSCLECARTVHGSSPTSCVDLPTTAWTPTNTARNLQETGICTTSPLASESLKVSARPPFQNSVGECKNQACSEREFAVFRA
jgi:hypothetical protein